MLHHMLHHVQDSWTPLVGRLLLSVIFLMSGFSKLGDFAGTVGYTASVYGESLATVFAIVAIVLELGGAILLVVGFRARLGAWMLIVFTLGTLPFHFDPSSQMEMIAFMKNVGLIGGLLMVAAYGAGRCSFDHKHAKTHNVQGTFES